jgi:cellulose synthase/poly-beta-1,6-N-acetylglucosamine synthase-like glycosyltransferase
LHRLDLPCQLTGTGMAFPWQCLSRVALAGGHIVEDMKLGIECARIGMPPLFCPDARVTSVFPASSAGIASQRRRWEHGHLAMISGDARRLIAEAVARRDGDSLALAVDLCVPPLALLTLLLTALFAACTAFGIIAQAVLPFWLATAGLAMSGTAVLLAWARHGRGVVSLADIARAPFYAIWKLPLYFAFFARRQHEWVRTRRDTE